MNVKRGGRNQLIDALKFFAIAMVPAQHLLTLRAEFQQLAPWLANAMLAFDMPLFTFLAGYVLFGREGRSPLRFLRGKALAILVPYVAWVMVALPVRHIPIERWPQRIALALVNPHFGFQMWYLWVLFALFVIFTVARLVSRSEWWTAGVAFVLALGLYLPLPQWLGIDKIVWLYPFLVLGYLSAKHRDAFRPYERAIAIGGVAGFPLLLILGDMSVPMRFVTAAAGIAGAWALFRLMPSKVLAPQAWVGQRTLGIYGAQMIVLPFVMIGTGWLGFIISEFTVTGTATLIAWLLGLTAVTRALFLGQWPKPASAKHLAVVPLPVRGQPIARPAEAESESEA